MSKTYQHSGDCEHDCDEFVKTDCVVYEEAIEYLGLEPGSSTTEIIQKLSLAVENLQEQINIINGV